MKILIKSAKIIDVKSKHHLKVKDVFVVNGKIEEIYNNISVSKADKVIEKDNLHLSSGWFDASVSFGEPGFEERETIENGLKVAAKSGFTAIAVNATTNPLLDTQSSVQFLKDKARNNVVDLHPIANLTQGAKGKELAELYDLKNAGAIAFGDYKKTISNVSLMKIALLYAKNFNGLVMNFPQEISFNDGLVNESETTANLGLKSLPALAEELQVMRDIYLAEYTQGKIHIPCISTEKSVKLIANAKKKGLDITCSVASHHLVLTDKCLSGFDSKYKVSPPLRINKDVKALQKGVVNGTIDMIVSDHEPIDIENKKVTFTQAENGTIGLESSFGFTNSVLPLETTILAMTDHPKNRFNLPTNTIEVGEKADFTLFNPDVDYTFSKEHIYSTSKNAIALGHDLKGVVYGVVKEDIVAMN